MNSNPPVVLVFAGNDPTGGAGIQADIQALVSMGCHPAPVLTAVTVQDTIGVKQFVPVEAELVVAQARAVLEDMPVAAFKTGMLGNLANLSAIASIVREYADIPLIVDPVLTSGRGDDLAEQPLEEAFRILLFPHATLITPNSAEARQLAPDADTLDACAQQLLSHGCKYVLITGTHEATPEVINRLYGNRRLLESFTWERLPEAYHGSGCTLASACAATLAHGFDPVNAVAEAQDYTWHALKNGFRLGMGQLLPDRLYWARATDEPREDKK
ncbi:MAG TPA: hydroxymethylpyrimidine/phosphomethylpyrimidine kinase [Acidiferrobacterales bacterium]|nr:hydroxymethylpyrimidine/phosphomethylpyrimidine kinase [Acidiferrobacterales bacterium]